MKKNIVYIILGISLVLNIVLLVMLLNKNGSPDIVQDYDTNTIKNDYYGLYQTTYYNNYNKQIIMIVRLNKDKTCTHSEFAAEYAKEGSEGNCTYEVIDKKIVLTLYGGTDYERKINGEILDSGTLFLAGKTMSKLN